MNNLKKLAVLLPLLLASTAVNATKHPVLCKRYDLIGTWDLFAETQNGAAWCQINITRDGTVSSRKCQIKQWEEEVRDYDSNVLLHTVQHVVTWSVSGSLEVGRACYLKGYLTIQITYDYFWNPGPPTYVDDNPIRETNYLLDHVVLASDKRRWFGIGEYELKDGSFPTPVFEALYRYGGQ